MNGLILWRLLYGLIPEEGRKEGRGGVKIKLARKEREEGGWNGRGGELSYMHYHDSPHHFRENTPGGWRMEDG